jgi:Na+/melibiose symporter-like transporter
MKHHLHFLIQFLFTCAAVALAHALVFAFGSFAVRVQAWQAIGGSVAVCLCFITAAFAVRAIPARRTASGEARAITALVVVGVIGGLSLFWLSVLSQAEEQSLRADYNARKLEALQKQLTENR